MNAERFMEMCPKCKVVAEFHGFPGMTMTIICPYCRGTWSHVVKISKVKPKREPANLLKVAGILRRAKMKNMLTDDEWSASRMPQGWSF